MTPAEFHKACKTVIGFSNRFPQHRGLAYAAQYARTGLHLQYADSINVQRLYILSNLSHWSGVEAREVKKVLKQECE